MPTPWNAGVHAYMHAHPQQGRRATRYCIGLIPLRKKFAAAAAAAATVNFFLSGIRAIFLNFVTFSTKHGATSDKACSRLLGPRYAHANAHRRPQSRCQVFAGELACYIYNNNNDRLTAFDPGQPG